VAFVILEIFFFPTFCQHKNKLFSNVKFSHFDFLEMLKKINPQFENFNICNCLNVKGCNFANLIFSLYCALEDLYKTLSKNLLKSTELNFGRTLIGL